VGPKTWPLLRELSVVLMLLLAHHHLHSSPAMGAAAAVVPAPHRQWRWPRQLLAALRQRLAARPVENGLVLAALASGYAYDLTHDREELHCAMQFHAFAMVALACSVVELPAYLFLATRRPVGDLRAPNEDENSADQPVSVEQTVAPSRSSPTAMFSLLWPVRSKAGQSPPTAQKKTTCTLASCKNSPTTQSTFQEVLS